MHTSNYLNESHTIANGVTYRHCNIIFIHTNPSNFTNASKARSLNFSKVSDEVPSLIRMVVNLFNSFVKDLIKLKHSPLCQEI